MYLDTWSRRRICLTVTFLCLFSVFLYEYGMKNLQISHLQVLKKPKISSPTVHSIQDKATVGHDATKSNILLHDTTRDNYTIESNILLHDTTIGNYTTESNQPFPKPCKKLRFPSFAMKTNQWQVVGPNETAFVYSAFREKNIIQVMGLSVETGQFVCQLWYTKSVRSAVYATSVQASVKRRNQPRQTKYRCTVFTCTLPNAENDRDLIGVSMSESPCQQPTNLLPVLVNEYSNISNRYTLCVSPLHDNYSRAHELIEWIELNRILGADKFIFYNFSCSQFISRILNLYTKIGLVSVLDWRIPHQNKLLESETWYFGQVSALNDCLFRNRGRSLFTVNIDLDEFIIPRGKKVWTWNQMLKQLPTYDVYRFSNTLFTSQEFDTQKNYTWYQNASKFHLVTLLKRSRDLTVFKDGGRSKYIARTQAVGLLAIHSLWEKTVKILSVPRSSGLLHHYRVHRTPNKSGKLRHDDTIVKKYKEILIKRVSQKWKKLKGIYD